MLPWCRRGLVDQLAAPPPPFPMLWGLYHSKWRGCTGEGVRMMLGIAVEICAAVCSCLIQTSLLAAWQCVRDAGLGEGGVQQWSGASSKRPAQLQGVHWVLQHWGVRPPCMPGRLGCGDTKWHAGRRNTRRAL